MYYVKILFFSMNFIEVIYIIVITAFQILVHWIIRSSKICFNWQKCFMVSHVLFVMVLIHILLLGFAELSIALRSLFDILENGISVLQRGQNQGDGSVFDLIFFLPK